MTTRKTPAAPVETPAPAVPAAPVLALSFEDTDKPASNYAKRAPKANPYAEIIAGFVAAYTADPENFRPKRTRFADKETAESVARLFARAARDNGVTLRKHFEEMADGTVALNFWFTALVKSGPRGPRKPKVAADA